MTRKILSYLIVSIISLIIAACGDESVNEVPNKTEENIESVTSKNDELENSEAVEATDVNETGFEAPANEIDESTHAEITEEVEQAEAAEEAEQGNVLEEVEVAANELQVKNQDHALNQLLRETHLEKEGYSYYFAETDSLDYIEIEVRELQEKDSEHESLEGIYRYLIKTEEILVQDYLTGDFIPYEKID